MVVSLFPPIRLVALNYYIYIYTCSLVLNLIGRPLAMQYRSSSLTNQIGSLRTVSTTILSIKGIMGLFDCKHTTTPLYRKHTHTMQLSAVFLFAATVLCNNVINEHHDEQAQSKANLEKIKAMAATTTAEPQEHYVTERIVHHTPPHMMIMLKQKHPRVYLEVLKIKEQVMVDPQRRVLSREAVASEHLYRVHRDGHRSSLRSRLYLLTPNQHQQATSAHGNEHEHEHEHDEDDENNTLDWFDRLALALHLDRFWPRLLFSLSAGFAIVALGFLILHVVGMWLGWHNDNLGRHDDIDNEYAALLNPNFRGPGVVSVHHYHDQIEKSAKMQSI